MTRHVIRVLLLLLVVTTSAAAAPVTVSMQLDGYGTLGSAPLTADLAGELRAGEGPCVCSLLIDAALHSGALTQLSSTTDSTAYSYADGVLDLTAQWLGGVGHFSAPVVGISSVVQFESTESADGPHSQDLFLLGPGQFDEALAAWLGVDRFTSGGELTFYLEAITGAPGDTVRSGKLNQPRIWIEGLTAEPEVVGAFTQRAFVAVPEPTVLSLLWLSVAAAAARRHSARRRSS